jgi:hypothetical protein
MNIITLDIETLPSDNLALLDQFRDKVKAPAQYKKPDSIAQWLDENRESEALAMVNKTGLDGLYGRVAVIGWAVGDKPASAIFQSAEWDERRLIAEAFAQMDRDATTTWEHTSSVRQCKAVGHNVEFDLKFLFHRAVRYGIKLPRCIEPKAWGPDSKYATFDTMRMWCRYGERVKLKELARELLGDTCEDIDGGEVAAEWARDPQKVVTHCLADVDRTRKLYKMMTAVL